MPRLFLVIAAWALGLAALSGGRAAEPRASRPEVRAAVLRVVEDQLAAFRRGRPEAAYGFASAPFRAQRTLEAFVAIVRDHYPEVWHNVRAEPGIVRDDGARATVTMQVHAPNAAVAYDYTLVREAAGWRIHGVVRHEPRAGGKA